MGRRQRLIVSLVCAALSMALCALYASHVRAEAERGQTELLKRYGGDVVGIVVAERTIEAGETIAPSDVSLRDWVSSLVPNDALLDLDEAVGRELGVSVASGVPLTELNLRESGELAEVPSGHVAVSVPITDKLGISTGIPAGTHVIAYRVPDGKAELVAQDATVLVAPASSESFAARGSLTIAVFSEDVEAVLAAGSSGDLRLVVPADDVKAPTTKGEASTDVEPVGEESVGKAPVASPSTEPVPADETSMQRGE